MKTEEMIRELRRLEEAHKNDFVGTCETNWSLMCHDVANWLEELLATQEPRVMTLNEVANAPEKSVVWLELKPDDAFKYEIYPFVGSGAGWYSCYCSANTSPMFTNADEEEYGVTFRCWTSRPDEKRMAETPWD